VVESIKIVVSRYFPKAKLLSAQPIGDGHINDTFLVKLKDDSAWIFQRINTDIFQNPQKVMENIGLINAHLAATAYPLTALAPVLTPQGDSYVQEASGCWRAFPYFENTYALESSISPKEAEEVAKGFAMFAYYLNDFEVERLHTILPDFHNPYQRFQHLQNTIARLNPSHPKLQKAAKEIELLQQQAPFLRQAAMLELPLRVTHNDTKANNILLYKTTRKAFAVIDLDTIQPGYSIYDFGDMVRTCCNPMPEDCQDFEQIVFQKAIYESLRAGYLSVLESTLIPLEKSNLLNGAKWIILEQAIRFLDDYLQGDVYYKTSFSAQNWVRAKGQLCLFESLCAQLA